jgi:hypothetical protein
MTVPITRPVSQTRTEESTDPIWLSGWLRLLLTGASLALNPALAVPIAGYISARSTILSSASSFLAAYQVPVLRDAFAAPRVGTVPKHKPSDHPAREVFHE